MNRYRFCIGRRQSWILLSLKDGDASTRAELRDEWFAGRLETAEQRKNARSKVSEVIRSLWRRGWINLEDTGKPQKIMLTRSGEIVAEKVRKMLKEGRCDIGKTYVVEHYDGPLEDELDYRLDDEIEGLLWETLDEEPIRLEI